MAFDRLDSVGLTYLWGKLKAFFATKSLVGDTTMGTTATTVTGAIKEHSDLIGSTTMGTTASTLTGAIAEHETDISNLNSKIDHKGIGVTLNSTGNEYFTHTATNGYILNGVYTLLIGLTTKKTLPVSSEFNIGTVSKLPTHTLPGFMVVTSSGILAGGVHISSSDGSIYVRATDDTPASRNIVINVTGFYTIT